MKATLVCESVTRGLYAALDTQAMEDDAISIAARHKTCIGNAVLLQSVGDAYTYLASSTLHDAVACTGSSLHGHLSALANVSYLLHMRVFKQAHMALASTVGLVLEGFTRAMPYKASTLVAARHLGWRAGAVLCCAVLCFAAWLGARYTRRHMDVAHDA
jgi:hypothetical protein